MIECKVECIVECKVECKVEYRTKCRTWDAWWNALWYTRCRGKVQGGMEQMMGCIVNAENVLQGGGLQGNEER